MDKLTETAINELLNTEIWSSNLYLALQLYFKQQDMPILASWLNTQMRRQKMKRIFALSEFLMCHDGMVSLQSLEFEAPQWENPTEALNTLLEHERYMAAQIRAFLKLVRVQIEDSDFRQQVQDLYGEESSMSNLFFELARLLSREWQRRLPYDIDWP